MSNFIRVDSGFSRMDKLDGNTRVADGTMFNVSFPDGSMMQMPVIIRRRTFLQEKFPEVVKFEEVAYFSVPYKGLRGIWMRAIDASSVIQMPTAKKKPKKAAAKKK